MSKITEQKEIELQKLVYVQRCTKVVKGGRTFSFGVGMVVGDGKGRAGFGQGKASEINDARAKATLAAKRNMIRVPLSDNGRTLYHDVVMKFCSGKVLLRAAPAGTGVIAGGAVRAFLEALGIKDVVAKSLGSSCPHNMIKATIRALQSVRSPRFIAEKRDKTVGEIMRYRNSYKKSTIKIQSEEAIKQNNQPEEAEG